MKKGLVALEHQALDTLMAFHLLATIMPYVSVSQATAASQARAHLASAMIVSCSRGYLNSGVNSSRAAIVGCVRRQRHPRIYELQSCVRGTR